MKNRSYLTELKLIVKEVEKMKKKNKKCFTLYKIYYESGIVYLGRTKQDLKARLRGHFFKKRLHRAINIRLVTRIEYAELKSEADMFLYEIYYINKLKPALNVDDKSRDNLTINLPEIEFKEFKCNLMGKWTIDIDSKEAAEREAKNQKYIDLDELLGIGCRTKAEY